MAYSHRDHRARRDLRSLYLGFAVAVGLLTALAIFAPGEMLRLLAVAGLAAAGAAYLVAVDRLTERYQRDLSAVRAGDPVSGAVRAEVYHEVGFERDRADDWAPSPHHRHPESAAEPPAHLDDQEDSSSREPERSDRPSNGS